MGRFDLIITDPPYGMNYISKQKNHKKIEGDDAFPIETLKILIDMADFATYACCRWNNILDPQFPRPKSFMAWFKNGGSLGDLDHEHGRSWEAIAFYPGPRHKFVRRITDTIITDRTRNDLHPTQKPVQLMRILMDANYGDSVFDPFSGSGSTLVAASMARKRCVGFELDESYCEIIANRLRKLPTFSLLDGEDE